VFPDDRHFFNPASMTGALRAALAETGQAVPDDPASLARVVLDSLALRYASVVRTIESLTGEPVRGIHVVGGGCRNEYLNQATADASGRPVQAGPVEATATGNLLLQAIACGQLGSLAEGAPAWQEASTCAASSRAPARARDAAGRPLPRARGPARSGS
jgi:rhamnulokinase